MTFCFHHSAHSGGDLQQPAGGPDRVGHWESLQSIAHTYYRRYQCPGSPSANGKREREVSGCDPNRCCRQSGRFKRSIARSGGLGRRGYSTVISKGKVSRPEIGIAVLDDETAAGLGVVGVVIERVAPDSEAERAGLQGIDKSRRTLGDVIIAVERKSVKNVDDFVWTLQTFKIGDTVTLEVMRGERVRDVMATLMNIS